MELVAKPIVVAHRLHPFDLRREVLEVPAGLTVAEILERAQPDPVVRRYLRVRLQGHDLAPEYHRRIRPKAGMLLEAVPLPQGGNPTLMRTILTIAIVACAMALGGWIAAPFFAGAAFTFASAGIGGALTLGGMLALALPPPSPVPNEPQTVVEAVLR